MADRYKCIQGHFTDKEHDKKRCPYDNMSTKELSELATQEIEDAPKYEVIDFPDEQLPFSLGARWANEEIGMPDGSTAKFVEGSKITNKQVFAGKGTKKPIRDIERLVKEYPNTKAELWQKVKGFADIEWKNEQLRVEIHWYEEPSIGRVETKYKKEL